MEEVVLKVKVEGSGDSEAKIKTVKQQLREAKEAALQAKEGTEEYFQALQKAAGLADQLKDVNESINTLNPGEKAAAFGNLINTVAGGFQTITGLYGLLGEKSEDVEKLLLKVQSASALAMGVQSLVEAQKQWVNISQAIKTTTIFQQANNLVTAAATVIQKTFSSAVAATGLSFNGLKAAIASTGIGLLVVGLGAAISKLMDYANSANDAAEKQAKLNKEMADFNTDRSNNLRRIAEEGGKLSGNVKILENQLRLMRLQHKPQDEILKKEKEIIDLRLKGAIDYTEYTDKFGTQMFKNQEDQSNFEKFVREQRKLSLAKQDEIDQYYIDKGIERAKKDLEERRKNAKEKDAEDKSSIESRLKLVHELDKIENEKGLKNAELRKKELDENKEFNQKLIEQQRLAAQEAADVSEISKKQQIQDAKDIQDAKFMIAQNTLNGLTALGELLSGNGKKNTAFQKTLAIAQIAIDTARSIASTIAGATQAAAAGGPAAPFLQVAYITSGIASVLAAMASAKKALQEPAINQVGGGGGSLTLPTAGGITPPSIQPPSNTSGLIQEGENFKVYVVESDITNSQMGVQQNKKKALITI
jgi:hypothetical protein